MPSLNDILQLTANGLIAGSGYAMLGASFALIYGVTQRFHFAFASSYTVAGYAAALAGAHIGAPFWLAVVIGSLAAVLSGVLIERFLYRPLAQRSNRDSLLAIFVASLGLTIIVQNVIRLIWLVNPIQEIVGADLQPLNLGQVHFTALDVASVAVAWTSIGALTVLMAKTALGRSIRAVRANPDMSLALGIDPGHVYLIVFAIGSAIAGAAGVLAAAQTAVTPDLGITPTLFAFVVAFLAGPGRSPVFVGMAGIGVGLVESWSGLWLSAEWATPVVFGMVVLYGILRSGRLRDQVGQLVTALR